MKIDNKTGFWIIRFLVVIGGVICIGTFGADGFVGTIGAIWLSFVFESEEKGK